MRRNNGVFRQIGRALCGLTLAFAAGGAFAAGSQQGQYEIRLLGRTWTPAAGVTKGADRALAAQAQAAVRSGRASIHALVQLRGIPDESQRNDLLRGGLDLGSYVPGNAWIATIPVSRAAAVARRRRCGGSSRGRRSTSCTPGWPPGGSPPGRAIASSRTGSWSWCCCTRTSTSTAAPRWRRTPVASPVIRRKGCTEC